MTIYSGAYHCGDLTVEYRTALQPAEWPFARVSEVGRVCRLHGVRKLELIGGLQPGTIPRGI